jgi:hypothetical protein
VSYGIVAAHDGRIAVDPGAAADGPDARRRDVVFSIVLPAIDAPSRPPGSMGGSSADVGTVLGACTAG